MLAVESRDSNDLRTISDLFYYTCDELDDIKFRVSLSLILDLLKQFLFHNLLISEEISIQFIIAFIFALTNLWQTQLLLFAGRF